MKNLKVSEIYAIAIALMIIIPTDLVATVKRLKATIDSMCNIATAAPSTVAPPSALPTVQQCNCAGMTKWISVNKTTIGSSTLRQAATITFIIPTIIPSNASEVLIHVAFQGSNTPTQDLKIFTQIGSTRYEKYLIIMAYSGGNTNSDNMWFPMPLNRRVYLTTLRASGQSQSGEVKLYAIGYR